MPRDLLGDAPVLNVAVLSTDRSRTHAAADIVGTSFVPADWSDALVLDTFFEVPAKMPD
jgi:hypothetical protein